MWGLSTNYSEGGQHQRKPEPSATRTSAPRDMRTVEGKVARKLVEGLDKMSFDTNAFAMLLISEAGPTLRRRILDVAIAIVKVYAAEWPTLSQDDVSRDARRLQDTLEDFRM
jgi:hypothetical protein